MPSATPNAASISIEARRCEPTNETATSVTPMVSAEVSIHGETHRRPMSASEMPVASTHPMPIAVVT